MPLEQCYKEAQRYTDYTQDIRKWKKKILLMPKERHWKNNN